MRLKIIQQMENMIQEKQRIKLGYHYETEDSNGEKTKRKKRCGKKKKNSGEKNKQEKQKKDKKILSLTYDNGIENKWHKKLKIPSYFCDPYSSWQKGGVENANKMIRR